MSTCARCGKEITSVINCDGTEICYSCCRRCLHHSSDLSILHCGKSTFFNKLIRAGINITKDGRIYMANYIVVIPPFKPATVAKAKTNEDVIRLIYDKVGNKPRSVPCHIYNDNFRLIMNTQQDKLCKNEKAMSITDEIVKGTAVIVIKAYGNFTGIKEKAAKMIADRINEFNSEEIVEDVGA